jgi:hypothetical protein
MLVAELAVGVVGWAAIMVAWFRARARHRAEHPEAGHG